MKNPLASVALLCGITLCLLPGCSGEEQTTNKPPSPTVEIKQVAVESLPIGNQLPPGVSKELRVSAPKEWTIPGRKSGYIAWFLRWDSSQVPLIALKESEATFADADTIDASNAVAYAESIMARLDEEGKEPLEEVLVIQFEDRYFVRYVLKGRVGGTLMERQILETQVKGKTYTLELRVLPGRLLEFRDAGYAVAASIEFLEPDSSNGE